MLLKRNAAGEPTARDIVVEYEKRLYTWEGREKVRRVPHALLTDDCLAPRDAVPGEAALPRRAEREREHRHPRRRSAAAAQPPLRGAPPAAGRPGHAGQTGRRRRGHGDRHCMGRLREVPGAPGAPLDLRPVAEEAPHTALGREPPPRRRELPADGAGGHHIRRVPQQTRCRPAPAAHRPDQRPRQGGETVPLLGLPRPAPLVLRPAPAGHRRRGHDDPPTPRHVRADRPRRAHRTPHGPGGRARRAALVRAAGRRGWR